ncbi:MAG: LysR family transcriptional regulator [Lachnospiraceae bacterium]|nr:LysR family transcriptional regulator [Lachnospiraceae bacterium]
MDIENLRTFLLLADNKSYTVTARQLYLAQSTVTNRINELEAEVHFKLFDRTKRSVLLTQEGEQFIPYAEKIVELADAALLDVNSTRKYKNFLRIGTADSIYEAYLAPVITAYNKEHPEDAVQVSISVSTKLIEQLSSDIYDLVFSYLPVRDKRYNCEVFKNDEMILVTDKDNRIFENGIKKEDLLNVNYIMCNFALQDVGQFIRGIFPKNHMFSLEIDDCSKVIPYLYGRDTYTFLPKEMAKRYLTNKTLIEIPLLDFKTPLISSYIIGKKTKQDLIDAMFQKNGKC